MRSRYWNPESIPASTIRRLAGKRYLEKREDLRGVVREGWRHGVLAGRGRCGRAANSKLKRKRWETFARLPSVSPNIEKVTI